MLRKRFDLEDQIRHPQNKNACSHARLKGGKQSHMNKLLVPCAGFQSCIFFTKPHLQSIKHCLLITSESPAFREQHSQFIFYNTSYFNEGNQHHHNNSETGNEKASCHKSARTHQVPTASSYQTEMPSRGTTGQHRMLITTAKSSWTAQLPPSLQNSMDDALS